MTREQAKAALPIIQAFADGKTIQATNGSGGWYDLEQPNEIYLINHPGGLRVKPQPREFWVVKEVPVEVWDFSPSDVWREKNPDIDIIHVKEVL
jgi:hypothetical protein